MIDFGIIRKIDNLGRIVLPKELRKTMGINSGDDFKILIDNDRIILTKYSRLNVIEDIIVKVIDSFSNVTKNIIYLVINNKIKNQFNEEIIKDITNKINERKTLIYENVNEFNLSRTVILKGNIIIYPIVIESDLLGAIIISGNSTINSMLIQVKIINEIIKKALLE